MLPVTSTKLININYYKNYTNKGVPYSVIKNNEVLF